MTHSKAKTKDISEFMEALAVVGAGCLLFNFIDNYIIEPTGTKGWLEVFFNFNSLVVLIGVMLIGISWAYSLVVIARTLHRKTKQ